MDQNDCEYNTECQQVRFVERSCNNSFIEKLTTMLRWPTFGRRDRGPNYVFMIDAAGNHAQLNLTAVRKIYAMERTCDRLLRCFCRRIKDT